MRRAISALVVAGVVLVGCGDDDDPVGINVTTTTDTSSTTATDGTTTTVASPPSIGGTPLPTDPEEYATAFIETWERGDMNGAAVLGTPEAVDTLFAFESGGPGTWSLVMCEGAAGSTYCTFNAGGDPTVVVRVANEPAGLGQNQAVTEVMVQA